MEEKNRHDRYYLDLARHCLTQAYDDLRRAEEHLAKTEHKVVLQQVQKIKSAVHNRINDLI